MVAPAGTSALLSRGETRRQITTGAGTSLALWCEYELSLLSAGGCCLYFSKHVGAGAGVFWDVESFLRPRVFPRPTDGAGQPASGAVLGTVGAGRSAAGTGGGGRTGWRVAATPKQKLSCLSARPSTLFVSPRTAVSMCPSTLRTRQSQRTYRASGRDQGVPELFLMPRFKSGLDTMCGVALVTTRRSRAGSAPGVLRVGLGRLSDSCIQRGVRCE